MGSSKKGANGSKKPKRFKCPTGTLTRADKEPFNKLAHEFKRLLGGQKHETWGTYLQLEAPTARTFLHFLSLLPDYQRPFKEGQFHVLGKELEADNFCYFNGNGFRFYLTEDGDFHFYDGQTRAAAFWKHLSEGGGSLPPVLEVYFTNDPEAYTTLDDGTKRTWGDIAHMRGQVKLSTGAASGIRYEGADFRKAPKTAAVTQERLLYAEPAVVEFVRSLPQSGGSREGENFFLAGLYAAAIRCSRVDAQAAHSFFTHLILGQNWLDDQNPVVCSQLVDAITALQKYKAQVGGNPGKVLGSVIGMKAFIHWYDGEPLKRRALDPKMAKSVDKNGKETTQRLWPGTMPSIPVTLEMVEKYRAA